MPPVTTSPLTEDLLRQLGDLARIPVADRLAAVAELGRIEQELVALSAAPDGSGDSRIAALYAETQFVLAGLLPSFGQLLSAGHRGSPAEHPPLADVLAALGLIKNALVESLPARAANADLLPTVQTESTQPETHNDH
jgi:hypothetical protein